MRKAGAEREISSFDEGELWFSDDATPPASPAGWYFRPKRGGTPAWVGPFETADEAARAPFSGDALRDAQRRLSAWQRVAAPAAQVQQVTIAEPSGTGSQRSLVDPGGQDAARAAAPDATVDTATIAPPGEGAPRAAVESHASAACGSDLPPAAAGAAATAQLPDAARDAAAGQLALDLGQPSAAADARLPRRGSRRRDTNQAGEQGDLPF